MAGAASKPFKFRYVNEIAGAFVVLVLIVVVIGIALAARAQKWFEPSTHLTVVMPPVGCFGLKGGAEVDVMGATVGAVDEIKIDTKTGRMLANIHVKPDFAELIRIGPDDVRSHAVIRNPIGLRSPFLDISGGMGPPLPKGGEIVAEAETSAGDSINQTLNEVRNRTLPAVDKLVGEYTKFASDLREPHSSFQETLARVDAAAAKLQKNDNVLGRLLTDPQAADNLSSTLAKIDASADEVRKTIGDLQKTAAEFPQIAASAAEQAQKLPGMVDQTREMMGEVQKAVKDLQKSTAQLPTIMVAIKQSLDMLPDVLAQTQQTLLEVQRVARGIEGLPLVRNNVEHTEASTTLRPADIGGPR